VGDLDVRTVDVLPPSASGEGRLVFQAIGAIVFGALLIVGLHTNNDGARPADLLPFQMLFRDAAPTVQRTFREMQEGLTEAETMRAASKQWPSVGTLAAQGIPPFAPPSSDYGWRLFHDGLYVGYVGAPAAGSAASSTAAVAPAFLALIQEPAPGYSENLAPGTPPDETHHRLGDGTLLHVTLWFRADGAVPDGDSGLTQPFAAGWTQVLVGAQRP
jgi:hypothetical protein